MKFLLECKETRHLITSHDAAGLTIMHYGVAGGNPNMIDLLISKVRNFATCRTMRVSVTIAPALLEQSL